MRIVDAGIRKALEIEVVVPVDDMSAPGDAPAAAARTARPGSGERRSSIWPSIYPRVLELVLAHRTTIIFCNARRAAERLAAKLNELYDEQRDPETAPPEIELARAHHGSLAREQRVVIEDQLKRGELRAIVATSSLELGIDMGAVDLVIQIESPGAVSRGLQRIGRAGHQVGQPSKGTIFPKHRGDLVEAAVVTRRMIDGEIEHSRYLRNPLDVLAQQIVAHVAAGRGRAPWPTWRRSCGGCANFHELSDELLGNVLDLLAGRYPSEEFSELRPRIVWDRVADTIRPRDGSKRLAVTSGGTIPDRGLFGVFLPDGTRVGELDEEMVYESRPGDAFVLGASTWRIEDISFERVTVTPAPGVPAKMPFWHGDRPGRPLELGRAVGAFVREIRELSHEAATERLQQHYALDARAAGNVVQYLAEQAAATGAVPDDRTIVVERFRDEIGDWRVCLLSPFGTPVHAPWAMAIERRFLERHDLPVETMWGDDGIVIRLPESADDLDIETFLVPPDEIDEIVVSALPQTSLFSARFRECAGRALLLPRRRPDRRTPLWQQRQRAADLLAVASKYPTFPILLETSRECLQDVFDVPALREVLGQLPVAPHPARARRHGDVEPDGIEPAVQLDRRLHVRGRCPARRAASRRARARPRPAARPARRRGAARAARPRRARRRRARAAVPHRRPPGAHRRRAPRRAAPRRRPDRGRGRSAAARATAPALLAELLAERRAIEIGVAGEVRFAAADDAAKYRDALGCAIPVGLPVVFTDPVPRPLEALVARYAAHPRSVPRRPRSPAGSAPPPSASRVSSPRSPATSGWSSASSAPTVCTASGATPTCCASCGAARWRRCAARSSRSSRRRSPASSRRGTASAPAGRGTEALVDAIGMLAGAPLVASTLERDVLPARVAGYRVGRARRAVHERRRGVARRRGDRCPRRPHPAVLRRPGGGAGAGLGGRPTRRQGALHAGAPRAARHAWRAASGGSSARPTPTPPTPSCWLRSGISCGRARSRTTRSPRCARSSPAAGQRRRKRKAYGAPRPTPRPAHPARPAGRRRSLEPRRAAAVTRRRAATEAAHASALQMLDRYGVVTREAVIGRGRDRRVRRRCTAC